MSMRGLGDLVAKGAKALGIEQKPGCGCAKRQETLNRWVPFGKSGLVEQDKTIRPVRSLPPISGGVETICSRPDIIFCSDFQSTVGCVTGKELACFQSNGYSGGSVGGYTVVTASDAVLGTRYIQADPTPGSTGPGFLFFEGISPKPIAANLRWYIKYTDGFISFYSGHGPFLQFVTDGPNPGQDGPCGSALKFQLSTYSLELHYDGIQGCGIGVDNITFQPNVGTPPVLRNGRWYTLEIQCIVDTACTNQPATGGWSGCNGIVRAWVDGVLTHDYNQNNWVPNRPSGNLGRTQSAAQHPGDPVWQNFGLRKIFAPEIFYHFEFPPWGSQLRFDGIVLSGNGTYIGCSNNDGSTGCPGTAENSRGTPDPLSPYGNFGPYVAYLGRHAGGDCTTGGGSITGQYSYSVYRNTTAWSLDPTRFHGLFTDSCVVDMIPYLGPPGFPENGELKGRPINALITVRDGQSFASAPDGSPVTTTGTTQRRVRWTGTQWVYTSNTDNSLHIHLTSSGDGSGLYHEEGIHHIFNQYSSYGWMWIPSGQSFTSLALSGFTSRFSGGSYWIAVSIHNGKWAVQQQDHFPANPIVHLDSTVNANFDRWVEYELISWNTNRVTLMIDRQRVLDRALLPISNAWMFDNQVAITGTPQPGAAHGVIDFQGTPPFDAWFDDNAAGTASFWSCADGWGSDCPPDLGTVVIQPDTTPPSITITGPTSAATYITRNSIL